MITFEGVSQSALLFVFIAASLLIVYSIQSMEEMKEIKKCYDGMEKLSLAIAKANWENESEVKLDVPIVIEDGVLMCKGKYGVFIDIPLRDAKLLGEVRCKNEGEIVCEAT